jgi:hypothetical protein
LEKYGKLFSNCGKSSFLTLTLRFHALVNSGIKIFGFGSEKWIFLVGKNLPYFSNSYMDENSYLLQSNRETHKNVFNNFTVFSLK